MSQIPQVASIRDAIPLLRRPFEAAAVKWKIQVNPKGDAGKALVVAFIDARLAGERLNAVCPDFWSDDYEPVTGGLRCTLTLAEDGDAISSRRVTRHDVGWSKGTGNDMDLKALYSDAFKRACVKFGIGVSIYALPQQWLDSEQGEIKKRGSNWFITPKGLKKLRDNYSRWLKGDGAVFGDAISHGDVMDSQGDAETGERGVAVETDDEAPKQTRRRSAPKDEAPKDEAPAAERKVSARGIEAITQEMLLSTKSGDDVRNWLTSKGVDEVGDLDVALAGLSADTAKGLHAWLKANRQDGAAVAAG